jgi:thymidine kinase
MPKNPYVTVIRGPMFAGKSTKLIKRAIVAHDDGGDLLVIKFSGDTRYENSENLKNGISLIISHDNLEFPAHSVDKLSDISDNMIGEATHIFVDEGQFFSDLLDFIIRVRTLVGVRPVETLDIAGLDLNHRRENFGQMQEAADEADLVISLMATCSDCEGKYGRAIYTRMDVADESLRDADIVVGGAETYTPVCAHCYER